MLIFSTEEVINGSVDMNLSHFQAETQHKICIHTI